jgi:hypothetical protein
VPEPVAEAPAPAGDETDRETESAGEEEAPRRSKTPSLPVIPLNKLYEFTPEETDFATGEQGIKARPGPGSAADKLANDASDPD